MIVHINNMVCVRCKMAVESVLKELEIEYLTIELGIVELAGIITKDQQRKLNEGLKHYGLQLLVDKKRILVNRIKVLILGMFYPSHIDPRLKLSEYLSQNLQYDYTYLSNVFSELEDCTIARFYILTKIERVKELIIYEGLSLKEISYQLNYSNVSHLCSQFKKVTGKTPSMFKNLYKSGDYAWKTCE